MIGYSDCLYTLGTINPDGSGASPVWPAFGDDIDPQTFAFAPDGNSFIYSHKAGPPPPGAGIADWDLDLAALDGTRIRPLVASAPKADTWATWSPDGTQIAFVSARDTPVGAWQGEIYVLDVATGQQRRLTYVEGAEHDLEWSPGGDSIVFARSTSVTDMHLIDPANGQEIPLTDTADIYEFNPSWAPDGSRIAFTRQESNGNSDIWTMGADGTDLQQITPTDNNIDWYPVWSPDGTLIAFTHVGIEQGLSNILTSNPIGGDQRQVTSNTVSRPERACALDWQRCTAGVTTRCISRLPAPVVLPGGSGTGPGAGSVDRTAPRLRLLSGGRLDRRGRLTVRLRCNEVCTVRLRASAVLSGRRAKTLRSPVLTRRLPANSSRSLVFRLAAKGRSVPVRRLIRMRVSGSAVDSHGNRRSFARALNARQLRR